MKNIYLKNILGLMIALLTLASCNEDDLQNASTMVPTEPTGSVSLDFSNPTTLIEGDESFDFTVSLSETQIVDVKVFLSQITHRSPINLRIARSLASWGCITIP